MRRDFSISDLYRKDQSGNIASENETFGESTGLYLKINFRGPPHPLLTGRGKSDYKMLH